MRHPVRAAVGRPASGVLAAVKRNSVFDHGVMASAVADADLLVGLLLILLFSVQLGWTPVWGIIAVQYFEPVTGFNLIDAWLADDQGPGGRPRRT